MPDYTAISRTLTEQQRCFRIIVEIPFNAPVRFEFLEERVSVDGAETTSEVVAGCSVPHNPEQQIPARNPNNDTLTGSSFDMGGLMKQLYSTYRYAATLRDGGQP